MALRELDVYPRLALDVVAAEGSELILADGRRVLDLYGGHCVNTLGAGDAEVAGAFGAQWRRVSFVTNLLDHPPRAAFLEALEANLPAGEWRVFLSNSGAEANENALKVALDATSRQRVVCFEGAFHGRTAAAAAISDVARSGFPLAPFEVTRLPWGDGAAARAAMDDTVAAVVLEPIQSMAGVRVPPEGFLVELRAACDATGATLVFDEVQTGNGRTGRPWAAQTLGVTPDVLVTAKGAAAGLPIGVTVLSASLASRLPSGILGSTFGGGPTVLAAACVVQRRIGEAAFGARVRTVSRALGEAALRGPVREVRGRGLLLGAVLPEGLGAGGLRGALLEHG
ncbi:MAG: aminotransferase class III-fold pyridoxal phosphate-dependent enzyme, partial [Planctomycetota bacterium]|nr:aminotransferase class III-fold pyridoxal phosphate-dependent enzyme [Planctomycetota bacterium]